MKTNKTVIIVLLIVTLLAIAAPAFADNAGTKLGRGVVNALTGWMEIPKNIYNESCKSNVLVGLTWGTIKGAGYCVARTAVGGYEIASFPIPAPSGYVEIMHPEFVFSKEEAKK